MFLIFLLEKVRKEDQNHGMFARNVDAGQMLHASEENFMRSCIPELTDRGGGGD
jgi:hypothetical protein